MAPHGNFTVIAFLILDGIQSAYFTFQNSPFASNVSVESCTEFQLTHLRLQWDSIWVSPNKLSICVVLTRSPGKVPHEATTTLWAEVFELKLIKILLFYWNDIWVWLHISGIWHGSKVLQRISAASKLRKCASFKKFGKEKRMEPKLKQAQRQRTQSIESLTWIILNLYPF